MHRIQILNDWVVGVLVPDGGRHRPGQSPEPHHRSILDSRKQGTAEALIPEREVHRFTRALL